MRDFTENDYKDLQKKFEALNIFPIEFKDDTLETINVRTVLKPTVIVAVPNDAECFDYAKKMWNFLLQDLYTVRYSQYLPDKKSGSTGLDYDLIVEEVFGKDEMIYILINENT